MLRRGSGSSRGRSTRILPFELPLNDGKYLRPSCSPNHLLAPYANSGQKLSKPRKCHMVWPLTFLHTIKLICCLLRSKLTKASDSGSHRLHLMEGCVYRKCIFSRPSPSPYPHCVSVCVLIANSSVCVCGVGMWLQPQ